MGKSRKRRVLNKAVFKDLDDKGLRSLLNGLRDFDLEAAKRLSTWFLELRKFLAASHQRKHFELMFNNNKVSFDLEELGEVEISPVQQLDFLELYCICYKKEPDCGSLIDGLLWSCHPKTISVPLNHRFQKNVIKVLCEKLLDREQPVCCSSSRLKCWRHELRGVKIERFGGIEDYQLLHSKNHLLDMLPSLKEDQQLISS